MLTRFATATLAAGAALLIAAACGTQQDASADAACGPKPPPPPWQPKVIAIECVPFCQDDQSSSYVCTDGGWVCPDNQIPVTACPCGGGLGPTHNCIRCSNGQADVVHECDVDAHAYYCPPGTTEPGAQTCDGGAD
jgi:hypothetical protein